GHRIIRSLTARRGIPAARTFARWRVPCARSARLRAPHHSLAHCEARDTRRADVRSLASALRSLRSSPGTASFARSLRGAGYPPRGRSLAGECPALAPLVSGHRIIRSLTARRGIPAARTFARWRVPCARSARLRAPHHSLAHCEARDTR